MARLTKRQRRAIQRAQDYLQKLDRWIQSPDVLICKRSRATKADEYTNGTDRIGPICKLAGSNLQYLDCALRELSEVTDDDERSRAAVA